MRKTPLLRRSLPPAALSCPAAGRGSLSLRALAALLAGLALTSIARAESLPLAFTIDDTALRIGPGEKAGKAAFVLTVRGEAAKTACDLALEPVLLPDPPYVEVAFNKGPAVSVADGRAWLVTAVVTSMPVSAAAIVRRVTARCGDHVEILRYTLDNSPAAFSWKLTPAASPRRWNGRDPLELDVLVGPRPATDVRLMPPRFTEPEGLRAMPPGYALCETHNAPCTNAPLALSAHRRHPLWIRRVDGAAIPRPGAYTGSFVLTAAEKPEGEAVPETLHVGDDELRVWGGVLIMLGIMLSFIVTRLLRQWADRAALLQPAAVLREELQQLASLRARVGGELDSMDRERERIRQSLELGSLRQYLPNTVNIFRSPEGVPVLGETYQQLLTRRAAEIGSLSIIVASGMLPALAEADPSQPDEQTLAANAVDDLDALVDGDLSAPEAVASAVRARLTALRAAIAELRTKGMEADTWPPPKPVEVGYTSERLAYQVKVINLAGWLTFALLSAVVGIYVLVIRDNDFGQPQDLILCLLWGLGLPSTGQGLASLTNDGVGQVLGMTVRRG